MYSTQRPLFMAIASIIFLSSCAMPQAYTTYRAPAGFTNVKGWNGQPAYYGGNPAGTVSALDIDGEIGHPLTVYGPSANCINASGQTATWNVSPTLASGTLPPGLVMDSTTYQIEGIPTERGHWIVTINTGDLFCDGQSYNGFTQDLRFHIKGSGKVVE